MSRTTQLTGAFGEKAAEAELLRRGWLTANVNQSVKNAADYDLIAIKGARIVPLRVKTTSMCIFQFSTPLGKGLPVDLPANDYTILVHMGDKRTDDLFYVMRTVDVRKAVNAHREHYLSQPGKRVETRSDVAMWSLHLALSERNPSSLMFGYAERWEQYQDAWHLLEADND